MRFPWLPGGTNLGNDFKVRKVIDFVELDGIPVCQLIDSQSGDMFCLLVDESVCPAHAIEAIERASFRASCDKECSKKFIRHCVPRLRSEISSDKENDQKTYWYITFSEKHKPFRLNDVCLRHSLIQYAEAKELSIALSRISDYSWSESFYLPCSAEFIPWGNKETEEERKLLISRVLTGNVAGSMAIQFLSPTQVHATNKWITADEATEIYRTLGLLSGNVTLRKAVPAPTTYYLPGQPELQEFYRVEIIDYHYRIDYHTRMGNRPPGGLLLSGPPRSGKTFSARHLAEFLGWKFFEVSIGSIASPYVHQTSRQIHQLFKKAIDHRPSIVFLDEIDAMGGDRDRVNGTHKEEEVSELLKMVEQGVNEGVIVLAATNRPEAMDKAFFEPRRFEFHIELKPPEKPETIEILQSVLEKRPHRVGMSINDFADAISGCSRGDVDMIVNEAGKIAVRLQKQEIDEECIWKAIKKFKSTVLEVFEIE